MITNGIYEWARTHPNRTAMIHNDRLYSYAVFARAIEATKLFFRDQKPPCGGTAIVRIGNIADAWIVVLGLRSVGVNTICVNSLSTARALNIIDVACIVLTEAERPALKRDEQTWVGAPVIVVPKAIYGAIHIADLPQPASDGPPLGGHILYTSGTTGSYKKVMRDGANERGRNIYRAHAASYDHDTVYFVANYGLWTNQGFSVPSAVWHVGGCVVLNQTPETFLRSFRHGITHAWFPPPMLKALLELRAHSTDTLGEFQLLVGGAFVSLDLAKRAVDRLTKSVTVTYAATEHASRMISRFTTSDDLHWLFPVVGSMFEIVDENGNECLSDKQGELRVGLRDIDATSYLDDEEASRQFFRGGYFYPGDMAVRRADGRIRILGRVADVLNLQGQKIPVGPIELKIQEFLGVNAVCLFSYLANDGKEELVVVMETHEVPCQAKLDRISHELKSFERVRFEVLKELPRTEAGLQKIRRGEVRKAVIGRA